MRRALVIAGLVGAVAGVLSVAGAPLLVGAAMLSPALALALALCCDWYPGEHQIEQLQRRRERWAPRPRRATAGGWRRPGRPSPFCAPHGPLLGLSLAVRPPPA